MQDMMSINQSMECTYLPINDIRNSIMKYIYIFWKLLYSEGNFY